MAVFLVLMLICQVIAIHPALSVRVSEVESGGRALCIPTSSGEINFCNCF